MNSKKPKEKYVAFLRGINVGGHHKVPMAELQKEMQNLNFENVVTLLNSGNVIFDSIPDELAKLEKTISDHLEKIFGFPVPVIIRKSDAINKLFDSNPFKKIVVTKDIRLYVSFLKKDTKTNLLFPWTSTDSAYKILGKMDNTVISVLDLSVNKTPKAMEAFEKHYGKDVTTRNWNTLIRIKEKLEKNC